VRQTIRGPIAERLQSRGVLKLDKMAETIEAFALAAAGVMPAPALVPAQPKSADPILGVLPFDNLSTDPEMQFFSDGVSEEIIQRLSRGAKLKVIGRTSSFQFRGERKSEAARALKCSHVLDGSVRRAGARMRIAAHLVDAGSHTTMWSDRYDRGVDDTFAVQDEISEAIADALHETFTSFAPKKAIDPAAYDLYLRSSLKAMTPEAARASVVLLEAAVARDPSCADAWGRLAYYRTWYRFYQPFREQAALNAVIEADAQRALAIDPQNVDALTAQFFVLPPFGEFLRGYAIMDKVRRTPGQADGHGFVGWHARILGRTRECAEITERLYRLDSLNERFAITNAVARMAVGQVAEAIPLLEAVTNGSPADAFPLANLIRAHAFLNDWDAVDRLLDPKANRPIREFTDGLEFVQAKRSPTPENIGRMRDALTSYVARAGSVDMQRLVYAAHVGLTDDVYRIVEQTRLAPSGTADVNGPDAYRTGILFWTIMPEIRNDPRFVKLCARLGLVEFWLATGQWPDCADEVPYDFKAECEKARDIPKEPFGF
jgi:TolB-like protein